VAAQSFSPRLKFVYCTCEESGEDGNEGEVSCFREISPPLRLPLSILAANEWVFASKPVISHSLFGRRGNSLSLGAFSRLRSLPPFARKSARSAPPA